jgi:hypothetical protein
VTSLERYRIKRGRIVRDRKAGIVQPRESHQANGDNGKNSDTQPKRAAGVGMRLKVVPGRPWMRPSLVNVTGLRPHRYLQGNHALRGVAPGGRQIRDAIERTRGGKRWLKMSLSESSRRMAARRERCWGSGNHPLPAHRCKSHCYVGGRDRVIDVRTAGASALLKKLQGIRLRAGACHADRERTGCKAKLAKASAGGWLWWRGRAHAARECHD